MTGKYARTQVRKNARRIDYSECILAKGVGKKVLFVQDAMTQQVESQKSQRLPFWRPPNLRDIRPFVLRLVRNERESRSCLNLNIHKHILRSMSTRVRSNDGKMLKPEFKV